MKSIQIAILGISIASPFLFAQPDTPKTVPNVLKQQEQAAANEGSNVDPALDTNVATPAPSPTMPPVTTNDTNVVPSESLAPAPQTAPSVPSDKTSKNRTKDKASSKEKFGLFEVDDKGLVNLDFVNVEISDLVKSISELTKKNFLYDENVKGRITLVSPRPVTKTEAYRAFLSALEVKDFAVLRAGKIYKIVPTREVKQQPIRTDVSESGGYDEFITKLLPVEHISAAEIVKSLRTMISPNGDMVAYGPTNTLIITDTLGNINRITKIISKLDQSGYQESIEIIKLKYSAAQDVAEKVNKIFDISNAAPAGKAAGNPTEERAQFISKVIPDERLNALIVVANDEGLRRLKAFVKSVDLAVQDNGKGFVHVHYLQYADATELAATLSGVTTTRSTTNGSNRSGGNSIFPTAQPTPPPASTPPKVLAGGGSSILGEQVKVMADAYTNSLIVTASPSEYEALIPVINKLDIRRPQAYVEAMILEVDMDKANELGVAGNGAGSLGSANIFGATSFGSTSSIFLPSSADGLQGLVTGIQGPSLALPLAGGQSLNIPIYGGVFKALQSNGTINILSTPSLMTQDNTEASIIVGRVVPFVTAQGRDVNNQPINQVQREDVALTLKLTPQINASDELTLKIFQESQDIVASANSDVFGPTTSRRSAETTVLVKDGQTASIGGLISDTEELTESKVPVLGDIPILGWLFKSKQKRKRKTSLVIYVTPHIIRYPEDIAKVTLRKEMERQAFLKTNRVEEHPGVKQRNVTKKIQDQVQSEQSETSKANPDYSPSPSFLQAPTKSVSESAINEQGDDSKPTEESVGPEQGAPPVPVVPEITITDPTPQLEIDREVKQ